MSSFKNYKRTISKGSQDSVLTVTFDGTGFALTGEAKAETVLSVSIDGGEAAVAEVYKTGSREVSYLADGLENGHHTAVITVAMGSYSVDGMQVMGGEIPLPKIEETVEEAVEETEEYTDESVSAESNDAENKKSSAVIPVAIGAVAVAAVAAGVAVFVKKKKK